MIRHIIISTLLTLFGSSLSFAEDKKSIEWTGCGISKKAFMTKAAKIYEEKKGVKVFLSGGGATKGIRQTNSGVAMMGGACRHSLPESFGSLEGKVKHTVVGWDAIVPIVNPANPVDNIQTAQIKDILMGKITNWRELGGPDQKIEVQIRRGGISGVGMSIREILFGMKASEVKNRKTPIKFEAKSKKHASTGPLEKAIEKKKWAFGITGISSAKKRKVKILKIDGADVTPENIVAGKISTFRPLYIVTNGDPSGDVKEFLDWLLSEEGQKVIEDEATVSVRQGKKGGLKDKYKHWDNKEVIINYGMI